MKREILIAIGVTTLFLVLAIQPSIAVQPETEIEVEPKDYLFQTIIDIANNPDVKELLKQYKPDMFKFDIDRSVYRKLFFRNPRLLFDTLFTKPSMSVDYLNECYNNGIEITNIIGEDKLIETIEDVEVTDSKLFDELKNIISKDEELSGRLETLKEMNKEQNPDWEYPIICLILLILFAPFLLWFQLFMQISLLFWDYTIISILTNIIAFIPFIPSAILVIALINLQCIGIE